MNINTQLAVFSTKFVIKQHKVITHVVHDIEGDWQFLSDDLITMADAMIVSLGSILAKDSSVSEVLDMKPGFQATRSDIGGDWTILPENIM